MPPDSVHPASVVALAFSELEEAFGDVPTEAGAAESFADLDDGYRPTTWWRWLFGRGDR
jgi:hypothetical protein